MNKIKKTKKDENNLIKAVLYYSKLHQIQLIQSVSLSNWLYFQTIKHIRVIKTLGIGFGGILYVNYVLNNKPQTTSI